MRSSIGSGDFQCPQGLPASAPEGIFPLRGFSQPPESHHPSVAHGLKGWCYSEFSEIQTSRDKSVSPWDTGIATWTPHSTTHTFLHAARCVYGWVIAQCSAVQRSAMWCSVLQCMQCTVVQCATFVLCKCIVQLCCEPNPSVILSLHGGQIPSRKIWGPPAEEGTQEEWYAVAGQAQVCKVCTRWYFLRAWKLICEGMDQIPT